MGMLDRYKKGGGILELVKLIEDSAEPKKTQLLTMVRDEDPEFAAQIEARIFTYDNVRVLPENLLAEVVAATPPKFVALVVSGETDAAYIGLVEKCLGKNFNDYKLEKENLTSAPPNPSQIEAARRKMVTTARKLESEGAIKLPIGEVKASASAGGAKLSGAGGSSGNASEEGACPPLESFGIEAPPPGLIGERFQTFLKNQLGS